jgi:hypothetical protein
MSLIQTANPRTLTDTFPHDTFALTHSFAGHPLFALPRLVELVSQLPRDRVEFNSGKAAISQNPDTTPMVDLDPAEIIRRIESCGAWMVLKHVESDPAYRAVMEEVLLSVARARGHASLAAADFTDLQGFIFVSSPHSTTPFHADSDENIFFQIHGDKYFHVYDNRDGAIASDQALEDVVVKHRNLRHETAFDAKAIHYQLKPGDGIFVPYQWPHFVQTADSFSISFSITWKSREVRRKNDIYVVNSLLRGIGLPQRPPGAHPALDAMKVAVLRSVMAAVDPLRKSEAIRRALRRLALGKNANYYYRAGKQGAAS